MSPNDILTLWHAFEVQPFLFDGVLALVKVARLIHWSLLVITQASLVLLTNRPTEMVRG